MRGRPSPLWPLDELAERVGAALARAPVDQRSGRIRDVPDARTIRYYTTLGLLDRAAEFRGRTALYSRRHLLQLVAIKRLQAQGLALAEVQARLLNATTATLERVAGPLADEPESPAPEGTAPKARDAFWRAPPAPLPEPRAPVPMQGVPVAEGLTVLLEGLARPLTADDLEALRTAAAPLLEALRARGLAPARRHTKG